ncbi:hypothetical protein LWI29_022634 [Acer saccharum]|uniref:WAT1-related protein n=1 Tax=Acer saccharum TaxID=4024 RepID=A0AA39RI98_ACESA|nr:hypothetical protein LWI29_022634 [Acer saccharum]
MVVCSTGKDLFPFMGMVIVILAQVSNMEVMKAAMSKGINKYVIIVYSDALSTIIFFISSLFIYRSNLPLITFSVLSRFFLLSVFGISGQIFSNVGIQYSSPTLGTAMLNLSPAFTFILAIIFRMEKLSWSSKISQAKSLGTIVSIAGAFVVTFYEGPIILTALSGTASSRNYPLLSQQSNWILGGFFLAAESFFSSAWNILQAIIGTGMQVWLCTWCLSRTGPMYVSMFKPLAIVFSVVMGFLFLGDALCLGSLIGAVIIVIGFYGVMWGKVKEQREVEQCELKKSSEKVPLLG